jgi:uncharacterized protein (DUF2236 family)
MSRLARDLGTENPPMTTAELWAQLEAFRPELRLSVDGEEARSFVDDGFVQGWNQKQAHRLFVRSSYGLMPEWARDQLGVATSPLTRAVLITPASHVLCGFVRRFVPPTQRSVA